MRHLAIKLVALIVGFALLVPIVPGITRDDSGSIVLSALVYLVINGTVGRFVKFVTAPMAVLTLGLWLLVINLGVLLVTDWLIDGITIDGIGAAILGTLWLTFVSFVVNFLLDRIVFRERR